jgi:membrane-bound serine protease (ClpP class)
MWCHVLFLVPFVLAGLFVFLPWTTALPIAVVLGVGTAVIISAAWRALRQPVAIGREAVVGGRGEAVSDVNPEGLVRVHGELWLAAAEQPVAKGQPVEVVDVAGAKVRVRPWT